MAFPNPAAQTTLGVPGFILTWVVLVLALALFFYTIYQRVLLIRSGQPDPRFSQIGRRLLGLITYGLIQKRQPRYFWAGWIHILIFWGFVILGLRSFQLVLLGLGAESYLPLMDGVVGNFYGSLKDIFELIVLTACLSAILRRAIGRPERYEVPNGRSHHFEACFVLSLISFLMISDMVFEGSGLLLGQTIPAWLPAADLAVLVLPQASPRALHTIHLLAYWLHLLTFFFFLNFLPRSKHFHILTALPNIFFRKLSKGAIKPVRWGVSDLETLDSLGVQKFEDFTWKHILDFFTCTECGRCSDNCPAKAVGRPLSPKMITFKLRDHAYSEEREKIKMVGDLISPDEIWSCTTCGACEEECPVFIEYIDKIIDMRRHLIETSQNPKTFNQVLMQIEKTGNPFGKPPKKRTDWVKEIEGLSVPILKEGDEVDVLFFVDSYASYDLRVQAIAQAIVKGLNQSGTKFGILGPREKDSGHQVRRMGEEGLFQLLVEENLETFQTVQFRQIVTTDPHAFNTLKKDYPGALPVVHYSQYFLAQIEAGRLKPSKAVKAGIYTYHDPCYLGRHNDLYQPPRQILNLLPGLKRVEMQRCRDRSFCCGGGDINLWHEIEGEEIRMAGKRIQMAREVGANVIVTACPFCLLNFEDAVKTTGLENELQVVDLMELVIATL
ncbi:MAG: electron transfer flavoprotein [Desulfobacca sp.]|nr:electron transfer flavoprotein [Desulfobacca sp.]